ncbi:MAG: Tol-Pal system subunit TolQ [Deltaproteobacteria bacterium]|nr:Tol-Pal system subunit TolQ [Deltaproteobacteria bacterium]
MCDRDHNRVGLDVSHSPGLDLDSHGHETASPLDFAAPAIAGRCPDRSAGRGPSFAGRRRRLPGAAGAQHRAVPCAVKGGNAVSFDLISLILQAGLIVKLVLLVLVVFSVMSWTIIATKWRELRSADQDSEAFLEVYRRDDWNAVYDAARHLDRSPLAVVFLSTADELQAARERNAADHSRDRLAKQLERSIDWGANTQVRRLERGMPFLATTGSAAPFIGLFGTVVGIIAAFQSIGIAGQASLAVVGPGIAEALVATAVGLLAAIPATIAYNAFGGRIDAILGMLERFSSQFQEDLSRIVQGQAVPMQPVVAPEAAARASLEAERLASAE